MATQLSLNSMSLPPPSSPELDLPRRRDAPQRNDDPDEESMRAFRWMALGGVSMALLLLALIVPQELAVGLAAIGLVGLFVFRISAMSDGWLPDVPPPAPREGSRQARQSSATFS